MKKRNRRAVFDGFERRDNELERHDQMLRAKSRALRQSAEGDQIESDDEVPQDAPGDAAAAAKGGARSRRARRAAQQSKSMANREASVIAADNVVQSSRAPQHHNQSTASTTATRGQQRMKRGKGRKGRGKYRDDSSSSDGEDAVASKKMMATAAVERKKADNHASTRRERKVPRHLQGQERLKIRGSLPEYMSCLPNEVWAMIIDFLDKKDLLLMSSVSVDWRWLALSHYRHHNCDDLIGQLDFLSANCPHLDSLHVLDAHLSLLPRSLRSLNLSGCHNITNQGMSLLPPALEHLDISECFLVSDIGLRNLSGVVGRTRDEIEEEERERARLVAEQQQREEEEAERRRRKGKAKLDDDADAIQSELESPLDFAPEVIAALPDLVSDDEDADEESTAQQPQPQPTEPEPEPAAGDVGRQLLPVVDNPPFPHLTSLLLHKCFAISSLDFLPRTLEELDISHLNLNFAGRCFTSLPPTIKKLTVTDCRVSDDSLWDLPPSLVYLDLTQCYFITDSGLQALYGMPYLKTLVVRACSRIYGDGLVSLPASLEQLVLSQTNIADESLDTLPASIKKLDLSFTSITNRALLHLPPNLEELNVGWCKHIDDEGLAALPLTLRALGLEDNIKNISDQALVHLYNRHSKSLRVLNLVGCDRITDEGLRYLPRNLTTLCLTLRPANISKNAMKKLQLSGRMELKVMESHRRKILLQAAKAK